MIEENFKEKWYLNNIIIGILLVICSVIPFASILGIPLVVLKSYRYKNYIKDINEHFSQIKMEMNKNLSNYKSEKENDVKKINELTLTLNEVNKKSDKAISDLKNANSQISKLRELISPDAKRLEELKLACQKMQNELEDLNNIKDKKIKELKKIEERAIKDLENEMSRLNERRNIIKDDISNLDLKKFEKEKELKNLNDEIVELRDEVLLQNFSLYKPQYDFVNSEQYKYKLDNIREEQKNMIRQDKAVLGRTDWVVNNDARRGKKLVNDTKKLLLRAFNSECEYVISKVRYNNFDTCLKRINKASETISKLGVVMDISIDSKYYELKVQELRLALEYKQMKQREKEEQQELRARMREEARIQREIEEERKKVEKEKKHYVNALKEAQKQLFECTDTVQKTVLEEKLDEMQAQVAKIDKNLADIDYREANQRVGYVYVISNIGSFGENIYKTGMTRRLNPQERVDELGNASVPFNFDVHAMIFSKDAPALENALHHAFDDRKVNMVNKRREFFNVSLDEIEKVVKENFDGSVEFEKTALAEQYRESLKIKKELGYIS